MMRPPSRICGTACCASSASAKALVSRHQRQCLSDISIAGLSTPLAALLTTMSMRSKCLRDGGEHLVDAFGQADAGLERVRPAAGGAQLRAKRLGFVVAVVVIDRDIAAAGGELGRDRAADTARGARDERNLSGKGA